MLGVDGQAFHVPLGIAPQRAPEILSRQEIARLFAATNGPAPRAYLMLAYGTGRRWSELCHLRVRDIDSRGDRFRVVQVKGGKDRWCRCPRTCWIPDANG